MPFSLAIMLGEHKTNRNPTRLVAVRERIQSIMVLGFEDNGYYPDDVAHLFTPFLAGRP